MLPAIRSALSLSLLALFACLPAAGAQEDPRQEIRRQYGFEPSRMSSEQQEAKVQELEGFHAEVERQPERYLPALRQELKRRSSPEPLLCHGGMLLVQVSKEAADRELGTAAMAKCGLSGWEQTPYLLTLHGLARDGFDTSDLALRVLAVPNYSAFLTRSATMLGQDYALICMLAPLDESLYLDKALKRLRTEKDETAQRSLLRLIWYTSTRKGDEALQAMAADPKGPALVQALARQLLKLAEQAQRLGAEDLARARRDAKVPEDATPEHIRALRRERMKTMDDDTLTDYEAMTLLMRASPRP